MRLILKKNSFQFYEKYYLQTHDRAVGTKMEVAFKVIFRDQLTSKTTTRSQSS